jgi:hypothetical protein
MKPFIISIFLSISLTSFCRNTPERNNKWEFGLIYSQDFLLDYPGALFFRTGEYTGYNSIRSAKFNYTIGSVVYYVIKPAIDLGAGLVYSQKDFIGTYYCAVCDFGTLPQPEPVKLRFVETPLVVRYQLYGNAYKIYVEPGLVSGILLTNKTDEEGVSNSALLLKGLLALGINYNLTQSILLNFSTAYKHSLIKFNFLTQEIKFRSFSFNLGITYKI